MPGRIGDPTRGYVPGLAGWLLAAAYARILAARRAAVLRGPRVRAPLPVVSIGNLVAGGTGKTPFAAWCAARLLTRGLPVAVVARPVGGAVPGAAGDELAVLAELVPGARVVPAKRKADGALEAARLLGPRGVVLVDDGFSHWALERDLDVVLVDSARPLGNGHLLPLGPLREPPTALARAHVVVATRADRLAPDDLARTLAALRTLAPQAIVAAAALEPVGLTPGGAVAGQRAVCLSGLARAGELARSARALGLSVVEDVCYPDHHRFREAEWRDALARAERAGAWLVVSRKDAVRLSADRRRRVHVLDVAWRFVEGGEAVEAALVAAAEGTR